MMLQYYSTWTSHGASSRLVFTAGAIVMMVRGVAVSTKLAGLFFGFEMLVLSGVRRRAHQERRPPVPRCRSSPATSLNGFSGLGRAFPLAIYLFIGWENSAALAEETNNPRRNVPRAVYMSVALMAGQLPPVRLRHRHRVQATTSPRSTARPSRSSPSPTTSAAWLALLAWIAGLDLHPRGADLGGELAGPADLQRRPGRAAAALARQGAPDRRTPVNAIFTFIAIATVLSSWSGRSAPGSAGAKQAAR